MTHPTKLGLFPLFALVLLMMPACSAKREGAAVGPSGSAPSSTAGGAAAASPAPAARRNVAKAGRALKARLSRR